MKKLLLLLLLLPALAFAQSKVICQLPSTLCTPSGPAGVGDQLYIAFGKLNNGVPWLAGNNSFTGTQTITALNTPLTIHSLNTNAFGDVGITRTSSVANVNSQGANINFTDTLGGTGINFTTIQNSGGQTEIWQENGPSCPPTCPAQQLMFWDTSHEAHFNAANAVDTIQVNSASGQHAITIGTASDTANMFLMNASATGKLQWFENNGANSFEVANNLSGSTDGYGVPTAFAGIGTNTSSLGLALTTNSTVRMQFTGSGAMTINAASTAVDHVINGASGANFDVLDLKNVNTAGNAAVLFVNDANHVVMSGVGGSTAAAFANQGVFGTTTNDQLNFISNNITRVQIPGGGGLVAAGSTFTLGAGTGACGTTSTLTGGQFAGSFLCTGTAGASTIVVNLPTASHGWSCWANDDTSKVVWAAGGNTTTSTTLSGTIATTSDKVTFGCLGY